MATAPQPKVRAQAQTDVKISVKKKPTVTWMQDLYRAITMVDEELWGIYDTVKFQGFNREEVLVQLEEKISDKKTLIEVVIVCSLRGPRQAENIKLSNGKTLKSMGIPASDQKGTTNLSCARISAATADLAAAFFKRLDIPKRILSSDLPGWLQFPSAGAIKMPDNFRTLHMQFSKEFSKLIGGEFNEQIYSQMIHNAYLDPLLKLFD